MKQLKNNSLRILVLIVTSLVMVACQSETSETSSTDKVAGETKAESTTNNASDMIAKAKISLTKAAEAGFEWSSTAPLIALAEKAQNAGDTKLAIEFANQAIKESENSLVQAKYADEHWQDHTIN